MAKEDPSIPVSLDHVAGNSRRYPGEILTFYSRVKYDEPASDLMLRVWAPADWKVEDYASPLPNHTPHIEVEKDLQCLTWTLTDEQPAGAMLEFRTDLRVNDHSGKVLELHCLAEVTTRDGRPLGREITVVNLEPASRYLRFIPEVYEQDEFMGRFLMLFESFWAPIDSQITTIYNNFDPKMTPPSFLPWLASWFGLELDKSLPEDRQRQLLSSAVSLYRQRGTRQSLKKYLEIYTGGDVQIIEHRGNDFKLGKQTRLGAGIALGTGNQPHTFTVRMSLPPLPAAMDKEERTLQEKRQRMAIDTIIQQQKPAHTRYRLVIDYAN